MGVCASLLIGAAALASTAAFSNSTPQNALLQANIEALSSSETGGATCTFSKIYKNQEKNILRCSGTGTLCCTMD